MKNLTKSVMTLLTLSLTASVYGKDFGLQSHTFSITEDNLKEVIEERLQNISEEDLAKYQDNLKEKIENGSALFQKGQDLPEATEYHSFEQDPSIHVREDILDEEGNIIVPQGTHKNPLDQVTLDSSLLFFNAENPEHIKWAKRQGEKCTWILTKGSPQKLQEQENPEGTPPEKTREVFFDQGRFYTTHFKIKKVPAKVSQQGKTLLIEEIPVEKRRYP